MTKQECVDKTLEELMKLAPNTTKVTQDYLKSAISEIWELRGKEIEEMIRDLSHHFDTSSIENWTNEEVANEIKYLTEERKV